MKSDDGSTRLLIDQGRSIDIDSVAGNPVVFLNRYALAEIERALAHYLGSHNVNPPQSL